MKRLLFLLFAAAAVAAGSFFFLQHEKQDDPVGNVDRTTGVWYPPYADRSDYDAKSADYGRDVARAFGENATLAEEVCYELRHSLIDETKLQPAAHALRATLALNCSRLASERTIAERVDTRRAAANASIDVLMQRAFADAAAIPPADRRATESRILQDTDEYAPVEQQMVAGTKAIALRPQDSRGAYTLLAATGQPWNHTSYRRADVEAWLDRFYRQKAGEPGPESTQWKEGLVGYDLLIGRYDEAAKLETELPPSAAADNPRYLVVERAVLDRLAGGSPAAFEKVMTDCPREASDVELGGLSYCWYAATSISSRVIRVQKEKAPPVLENIMVEALRANPKQWPYRMETIREIQQNDPKLASSEYQRILGEKRDDVPEGAILDTIHGLSMIAWKEGDEPKMVALTDCWLRRWGVDQGPVVPEVWRKIALMPAERSAHRDRDDVPCFADTLLTPANTRLTDCAARAYERRMNAALEADDMQTARQSVELLADYSLRHALTADMTRFALVAMAAHERDKGRPAEARQIAAYLMAQPHGEYVRQSVSALAPPGASAPVEPWPGPTKAGAKIMAGCP